MPDWRALTLGVGGAVAGVAAGYAAERLLMRSRIPEPKTTVELGTLDGDEHDLRGPHGSRLRVETHGSGSPEIVLVHGFANGRRVWHEQISALRDRYRLVTYDQPGHGDSTPADEATLDAAGDCLAHVVAEASGGRIVLVGHSLGGMTALAYARRHPEAFAERVGALLLLSTAARMGRLNLVATAAVHSLARARAGAARLPGPLGRRAREAPASNDLTLAIGRAVGFVRDTDPHVVRFVERMFLGTPIETMVDLGEAILGVDEEETITALDVPTVVVVSADDRLTPLRYAEAMAERNPDIDLVQLSGAGHMTPLTAPAVVNALIGRLATHCDG